jgi:uncharacterized protein (DUF1919 family)
VPIHVLRTAILKRQLKTVNFTIISSNCWGAEAYKELNLQYSTPFVGMFMFAPCYIKMLKDLKSYMVKDLDFIDISRYEEANITRKKKAYPIGLLGGNVEIHFLHYSNAQEASAKWIRRKERINWENLFVEFSDRDNFTTELLEEFEKLPFPNKICFTSLYYPQFRTTVWIKESEGSPSVMDGIELYKACKKYFNLIGWLNGGSGVRQK